ncbi:hypothetical protein Hanom_Chr07g00597891 [Helianthus anomalus]
MVKEDANSRKVSDVPAALKELNENVADFTLADSSGYFRFVRYVFYVLRR